MTSHVVETTEELEIYAAAVKIYFEFEITIYLMHPWVTCCMIKNFIIHLYQPLWCFCQASIC